MRTLEQEQTERTEKNSLVEMRGVRLTLMAGPSSVFEKRGGKRFKLTRIDSGSANFNERMDQIFREIPPKGKRVKTNLARLLLAERE